MQRDVLLDHGHLFLGSRLKRLAERFQADAAKIFEAHGYPMQPSHMPLIAAIDRYGPLTVNEAVDALGVSQPAVTRSLSGLVALGLLTTTASPGDGRVKVIALTEPGKSVVAAMKQSLWPLVDRVVTGMCSSLGGPLLTQIKQLEDQMTATSFADRALAERDSLSIVEFTDDLAQAFHDINAEWLTAMFAIEETDRKVLGNPRGEIVDKGGVILFARSARHGIVGTCALKRDPDGAFELTKMAVREAARGQKAGEFLLRATIDRATEMGVETLYLLTNSACAPAIHLYEKLGFKHDAWVMRTYGAKYERCDVAMLYLPTDA